MYDEERTDGATRVAQPPRDNLVRAVQRFGDDRAVELRDVEGAGMPTMFGHFSVFDQWAEINSAWEGRFMERIAPGAFKRTFDHKRAIALFQHGKDPQIGDKILGPTEVLREDEIGAYYEVPLLDTSYNRDLVPGLKADLYGASFRFSVLREEFNKRAKAAEHNPEGLPERTVLEASVPEFGPVTFPAYEGASAGIRSMTDDYILATLGADPERLVALFEHAQGSHALPSGPGVDPHSEGTRGSAAVSPTRIHFTSREEWLQWIQRT